MEHVREIEYVGGPFCGDTEEEVIVEGGEIVGEVQAVGYLPLGTYIRESSKFGDVLRWQAA